MELIIIKKVLVTLETGLKINNMDLELNNGLIIQNMKVITIWELNKVKEHSGGLKDLFTKVNLVKTLLMEKELINGLMEENTQDNGRIIKCTEKDSLNGQITEFIKVNIKMIKNME